VKQAVAELELDEKRFRPGAVLATISRAKSELKDAKQFSQSTRDYWEEAVARIYKRYADILERNNALDFDDLLMKVVQMFNECPEVLQRYQEKYEHILVDEMQDTNPAQYAIVKAIAAKHKNILVVGDPDQSIYAFRAADIRNILNFEHDFPQAKTILLEQNYRSTQTILDTAHAVIIANRKRKKKNLWTENDAGLPVTLFEAYNENEEADFVVSEIKRLVARGIARPRECAVMYRTNAQSRALEEQFLRLNIPYKVIGSRKFYERKEIKDMLAYLRLLLNSYDDLSLQRIINVPNRTIGPKTLGELQRWADEEHIALYDALQRVEQHPTLGKAAKQSLSAFAHMQTDFHNAIDELRLPELIDRVAERSGLGPELREQADGEERWSNVLELRRVAGDYAEIETHTALELFLENVALVGGADTVQTGEDGTLMQEENRDAVTLITLHAAKGLEYPVVFIVGMDEGSLPTMKTTGYSSPLAACSVMKVTASRFSSVISVPSSPVWVVSAPPTSATFSRKSSSAVCVSISE